MESTNVALTPSSSVSFDDKKGKEILAAVDDYITNSSKFDYHSKMGIGMLGNATNYTNQTLTPEDQANFTSFQSNQVMPLLNMDLKEKLTSTIQVVSDKIKDYPKIPLPETIYLNITTGQEEANASYCRSKYGIFLSDSMAKGLKIQKLLAHELWHIISRNMSKENRDSVYGVIGFKPMNHIFTLVENESMFRISNPDAVYIEYYLPLLLKDGTTINLVPIIYSTTLYNPVIMQSFFRYVNVGYLELVFSEEKNQFVAKLGGDGKYIIHGVDSLPEEFWNTIGRNTRYLYHYEEIIADNFAALLFDDVTRVKSPDIYTAFHNVLMNLK